LYSASIPSDLDKAYKCVVNENKMEIKTFRILVGLNGYVGSNKVNPPGSCVVCVISAPIRAFRRKLQNVLLFRGQ
jgi:hypothetical protein